MQAHELHQELTQIIELNKEDTAWTVSTRHLLKLVETIDRDTRYTASRVALKIPLSDLHDREYTAGFKQALKVYSNLLYPEAPLYGE